MGIWGGRGGVDAAPWAVRLDLPQESAAWDTSYLGATLVSTSGDLKGSSGVARSAIEKWADDAHVSSLNHECRAQNPGWFMRSFSDAIEAPGSPTWGLLPRPWPTL